MQSSTIYLILAVICITIGFIAGALISMLFAERDKKQLRKDGDLLPEGIHRDTHTALLRLWRAPANELLVELRGRILTDVKQASTAQRLELEAISDQWHNWLGVRPEVPKPAIESNPPLRPQPPLARTDQSPLPQPVPTPKPAITIVDAIANPPVARPAPAAKTMIEQVDEILQELISRSDQPQRSVKVTQDFHDGIVVWLDGGRYPGLDSVPDAEIRKMIRMAAAEWERRSDRAK